MKIKEKIDCCGSNFETNSVSFVGLLTLSMPMILLSILMLPIILFISLLPPFTKLKNQILIIIKANSSLIEKQTFFQNSRCNITAFLSKISITLSNKTYYYFNHIVLLTIWIFILTGVYLVV
jgi:hypothetical protein